MTDPLGLIGDAGFAAQPLRPVGAGGLPATGPRSGPSAGGGFREMLEAQIAKVNELQQDATRATEDLIARRRDDIEGVILATQKADIAFRLLLQVRNKMMAAYEEVKQIRI